MENHTEWESVFNGYVSKMNSPDRRCTFETSQRLADRLVRAAAPEKEEIIIDMGAGWGNLCTRLAPLVCKVIAIEPEKDNLKAAKERAIKDGWSNIQFIQGSFEKPCFSEKVDCVISSLVFHQVPWKYKKKAIEETRKLLKDNGRFIFCDTLMFFNAEVEPQLFNQVYRFILPRTMPIDIHEKQVKPSFDKEPDYVYTWEDMKRYTPKNHWLYSLRELEVLFSGAGFEIEEVDEIAPFFSNSQSKNDRVTESLPGL